MNNLIKGLLVGPTNSGKSTLLNALAKKKVSIVSKKIQTTNINISYPIKHNEKIIFFVDTPGLYKDKFIQNYTKHINSELNDSTFIIFLFDITVPFRHLEKIKNFLKFSKKNILVLNKIDMVNNDYILNKIKEINFINDFDSVFYISALKGKNIFKILDYISENCTTSKIISHPSKISKEKFVSEITRESLFKYLNQELPYHILVDTEKFIKNKIITIHQTIRVTSSNHKKIIIGVKGSMIKKIGTSARIEIEKIFKKKINLFINIKVIN